jgi:hypothetical protein
MSYVNAYHSCLSLSHITVAYRCCLSLSLITVAYCCRLSLSLIAVAYRCRLSLSLIAVAYRCRLSLSLIAVAYCCRLLLSLITIAYHYRLSLSLSLTLLLSWVAVHYWCFTLWGIEPMHCTTHALSSPRDVRVGVNCEALIRGILSTLNQDSWRRAKVQIWTTLYPLGGNVNDF